MDFLLQASGQKTSVYGSNFRSPGYLLVWATSSAFLLGLVAFSSGEVWLLPAFFAAGYAAICLTFLKTIKVWRDVINPLCLVLAIGFFRFLLPGLLFLLGTEPPDSVEIFFQLMQLSDSEWLWGHVLAMLGILAALLGWLLTQSAGVPLGHLRFYLPDGTKYASIAAMFVGLMALASFFLMNASIGAILSGAFRSTTVQVGTGKYFFLAYLLIVGSIFLCCYLLSKNVKWWCAFVPLAISMIAYWPLGGRGRAVLPVVGGVILVWYINRERKGWSTLSVTGSHFVKAPVIGVFVIFVFYLGSVYRGNSDPNTLFSSLSITGLSQYLAGAIYVDLGQLHSLAGAIAIGPGVLEGKTFMGSLSWPLSAFLPIPARSTGVYIIEELVGFPDEHRWGVAATLIGDAYVNFGLHGVIITMAAYGAVLKLIYVKFRQGVMHSTVYVIAMLASIQMLWGSIEVWSQVVTMSSFALAITLLGKTVFNLRLDDSRARLVQNRGWIV